MGNIVANRSAFPEEHGTHQVKVTGIKNLGSTCYMNTLIQSLFVTPVFRIKINECQNVDESIASDLQDIFIRLEQGVHSVEPYRLARSLDQMHWTENLLLHSTSGPGDSPEQVHPRLLEAREHEAGAAPPHPRDADF
ncbi:UNVERIFIED_CONTAM: hypothetical protein FKN15_007769 [Acipenser sinensis]